MKYRIQCSLCSETFTHSGSEYPDECPLCKQYIGLDGKPEVSAPFISLKGNKSPDDLFKHMQNGAEHRMQMAAEVTGAPVSDFSHMKITDMKDNLRQGDTVFKPVSVPQEMAAASSFAHPGASPEAQRAVQGAVNGPHARAGSRQIPIINDLHRRTHQASIKMGQVN